LLSQKKTKLATLDFMAFLSDSAIARAREPESQRAGQGMEKGGIARKRKVGHRKRGVRVRDIYGD
jgi:hypothetical protein